MKILAKSRCLGNFDIPKKFIKIIHPSKRLYHGRSVTKYAPHWTSESSFRHIMWWALEQTTPLMYASMSIKGRSLDTLLRWDIYETHLNEPSPFLIINKESIEFLTHEFNNVKCEGKTIGKWLREAFPIRNGKLYRRSHVDSDRKMALCLCDHIHCVGYIANEIPIIDGPGKLHKELLVCYPAHILKLTKYSSFNSPKSQLSVERFLKEQGRKLKPDTVVKF